MELLLLKRKTIIIMFKSIVLIVWCMIKQNIKKENIFYGLFTSLVLCLKDNKMQSIQIPKKGSILILVNF